MTQSATAAFSSPPLPRINEAVADTELAITVESPFEQFAHIACSTVGSCSDACKSVLTLLLLTAVFVVARKEKKRQ